MQSPDGNQLWCPGQSLWSLIAEHVLRSELSKIHTALGHSLVDMYTEVHTEAEIWHKIWQESQQGNNSSRTGTPIPTLADPPAVKELVRAEVKMLLQTLRERASREGKDGEELLFRYKPQTVDFALSYLDSCYRNCTTSGDTGDTDNESRPSSHRSVQSGAEDEIEAMKDKLNVTDIDQVVDRLRSVLMEECEALNRLVKHFKENIKQKCLSQCEFDNSEPTLAELKELRGAIQTDLELYPSSLAASPSASSPVPLKELKNRLSAGQTVSDETLQALSTTSALKPHPPPPLSHHKPRPPPGAPPSKTSASVKLIHSSSPSRTHGQHRSTSASTGPREIQTPICKRITTSGHMNRHFTTSLPEPDTDMIKVKAVHHCSVSPEQDSAGLHCTALTYSPSFQIQTPRKSSIHETHLSSHHSIHGPSRQCELSQMERKSSPASRSRNITTKSSSLHCDAGSHSSNTDQSVSTTVKCKTQNERQSSCGGSLVSVQTGNDRRKSSSESFQSGSRPAQTDSRKSINGVDRNKNGHLGNDLTQQQSLEAACTRPAPIKINGQFFTSPKRQLEGTTSQLKGVQETQTELGFISKFYQPVPPGRVST